MRRQSVGSSEKGGCGGREGGRRLERLRSKGRVFFRARESFNAVGIELVGGSGKGVEGKLIDNTICSEVKSGAA